LSNINQITTITSPSSTTHITKTEQRENLVTLIAETVLERPSNICPQCIETILKITKSKLDKESKI
jgi:hypothetical protein